MPCPRCHTGNPPGARFCSACGLALPARCASCGASLSAGQRFCSGCGADLRAPDGAVSPVAAPPPTHDAERRQATVMFSDLCGYTALNEALDPEEVEMLMARIKQRAIEVVESRGGTVNQFVGDEIMALFGVPVARRDDARNAVAAALELHGAVGELVATLSLPTEQVLDLHTGINTGLVVARRSDARAGEYALTGDAVNTAARLRGLARPGEVVVSASTWLQVADFFHADAGAPVAVKGKEHPLVAYRVLGERLAPAAGGVELVGRDEERRDFQAMVEACAERRRSRVVIVRGDPGVGKSRLVGDFMETARAAGLSCHSAAVLDFGAETGRDAVRSLARSLIGVAGNVDEATRRDAICRSAAAATLGTGDRQLFLHDLLDVAPPPELRALAAAMSTAAREQGSLHALCDLVAAVGTVAPLLLVIEDIHWADAWTLDRLAALAVLAVRQPLLLVMTTRFAGDPTAAAWRTALHGAPVVGIDLGPLGPDDSLRLATRASSMPAALVESCVERAEGNPLFLLQLLLNAGEAAQALLPGSIQALVHTRVDRLPAADKTALQAAAALGQRYSLEALRHLIDDDAYDCRLLADHFLVRADGAEFMFCHALIRDGVYASMLHKRRRALHARAGEWFSRDDLALAAEHFDRAEDARAAPFYLKASEAAATQFRHGAALTLVERGLALAAEQGTRFAMLMTRGRLLLELGRSGDAIDACRTALATAAGAGERATAMIAMAAGMRLNDRIAEGLATLDEAQPLAEAAGIAHELSRLHHLRGNLLFPLGRAAECLSEHERARGHARASGSLEAEAAAIGGLGDAYYLHGRMRSANQQFRACVALAREHGFGRLEVANLSMIGWTGVHLAEVGEAVVVGHEAIALAMRASQPRAEILARSLVHAMEGRFRLNLDDAERHAAPALPLIQSLGAKRFEAQMYAVNAVIRLHRGDRPAARELADHALAICREHGMGHTGPFVYGVCALVETDPATRVALLEEGARQLALGCVSHNHLQLPELAIDALLEIGDWDGVDRQCERIRSYTASEPLAMGEFIAQRGEALARFGRGDRGQALRSTLAELHARAARLELNTFLPALAQALERLGTPPPPSPGA